MDFASLYPSCALLSCQSVGRVEQVVRRSSASEAIPHHLHGTKQRHRLCRGLLLQAAAPFSLSIIAIFSRKTYHRLRQAARRGVSFEVQGSEIILCDLL
jgi:hypothetical protein